MLGNIKTTNFGKRHFEKIFSGTKITDKTPEEFDTTLNSLVKFLENPDAEMHVLGFRFIHDGRWKHAKIIDGYAPFCKLIVMPNFTNAKVGTMPIDIANHQYLRHGYSARTEKELAVLSRWFELPIPAPVANYLVIIIYSKEQLKKEREAEMKIEFDEREKKTGKILSESDRKALSEIKGFGFEFDNTDVEWGIVAILAQSHPNEEPMPPITMMRNALGIEEGGSGVALDKVKYADSVEFWSKNAIIKS